MSIDVVAEKIRQKALEDSKITLKKAEAEASEIRREILNKAEQKRQQILHETDSICRDLAQIHELKSKLQARKNNLEARKKMIADTADLAVEELKKLDNDKLLRLLENFVLKNCMPGMVEIVVSKRNFDKYKNLIEPKIQEWQKLLSQKYQKPSRLVIKAGEFASDSIVLAGENWDIDCRFEVVVKDILEKNEKQISKILFK